MATSQLEKMLVCSGHRSNLFEFPCKQISPPVLHELDARVILAGDSKGSVLQY